VVDLDRAGVGAGLQLQPVTVVERALVGVGDEIRGAVVGAHQSVLAVTVPCDVLASALPPPEAVLAKNRE
jgi:hypothetical protein